MKNFTLTVAMLLLFAIGINAQSGIQFYGGINYAENRSELITPEGFSHAGYLFGLDARINEGKMYFGGGVEISKINFLAASDKSYFSVNNSMNWLKLRFGLGYQLIKFNKNIMMRMKTYGSINMISSYPDDMIDAPYSNYNSAVAAAVVGLGFDIHIITLDIEYERGFFNAVNMVNGTEFDFYKMMIGFKF